MFVSLRASLVDHMPRVEEVSLEESLNAARRVPDKIYKNALNAAKVESSKNENFVAI